MSTKALKGWGGQGSGDSEGDIRGFYMGDIERSRLCSVAVCQCNIIRYRAFVFRMSSIDEKDSSELYDDRSIVAYLWTRCLVQMVDRDVGCVRFLVCESVSKDYNLVDR